VACDLKKNIYDQPKLKAQNAQPKMKAQSSGIFALVKQNKI
jgi:hypothetical protein